MATCPINIIFCYDNFGGSGVMAAHPFFNIDWLWVPPGVVGVMACHPFFYFLQNFISHLSRTLGTLDELSILQIFSENWQDSGAVFLQNCALFKPATCASKQETLAASIHLIRTWIGVSFASLESEWRALRSNVRFIMFFLLLILILFHATSIWRST